MANLDNPAPSLSHSFGVIRHPVADPVTAVCVNIAHLRGTVLDDAEKNDGFIKDKNGNFLQLDPVRYKNDIAELTRRFDTIPFRDKLFNHGGALSHAVARKLKINTQVQDMRSQWPGMSHEQKIKSLSDISTIMIDTINDSERWLCLNYPTLALAQFAATKTIIGMQVQEQRIPGAGYDDDDLATLTLISVNRDCHSLQNFDEAVSMLWHEHMHMYMSAMRDGLKRGFLKQDNLLYKDIRNSCTIAEYKITGNFYLAESIYLAEPEEKFCYAAQTVFHSAFSPAPVAEMRQQYG